MGVNQSSESNSNNSIENNQQLSSSTTTKSVNPLSKESLHQNQESNIKNNSTTTTANKKTSQKQSRPSEVDDEEVEEIEEVEEELEDEELEYNNHNNSNQHSPPRPTTIIKATTTSSLSPKAIQEANLTLNVTRAAAAIKQNTKPLAPNSAAQADHASAMDSNNNQGNDVDLVGEYQDMDNNQNNSNNFKKNSNNESNLSSLSRTSVDRTGKPSASPGGKNDENIITNNSNNRQSNFSPSMSAASSSSIPTSMNNGHTNNGMTSASVTAFNSAQPSQHSSPQPPNPNVNGNGASTSQQQKQHDSNCSADFSPVSSSSTSASAAAATKKRKVLHGDNIEYKYPSGSVYKGSFKDGKLHGFGRYVYFPSNDVYEGEWENDMKHGLGVYTYEGGDCYTGDWRNGKKHGRGTYAFQTGDEYIGGWKEDKIHGYGTFFVARNGNRYEGEWKESYRHGQGILRSGNGNVYEGSWEKGKEDGLGVLVQPSGRIYAGHWKQGQMDGKGILFEEGQKHVVETIGGFVTMKEPISEEAYVDPAWNVANRLYQHARAGKVGVVAKSNGIGGGEGESSSSTSNVNNNDGTRSLFINHQNNNNHHHHQGGTTSLLETKLQQVQVERDLYRQKYEDLLALKGKTIPTPDGADDYIKEDLNPDSISSSSSSRDDIVSSLRTMVDHARSQRNAQRLRADEFNNKYKSSLEQMKELEFLLQSSQNQMDLLKSGNNNGGNNSEAFELQRRVAQLEAELRTKNSSGGGGGGNSNNASSISSQDVGALQAKVELLETEKQKLIRKCEEFDKIRTQATEFSKEITALQKKNADLEKEVRVRDQRFQFDNQQVQSEQSELQKQQQQEIRELRSQLDKAAQELDAAQAKSRQHLEKLRAAEGLAAQSGEFQAQLELLKQNRQKEAAAADRKAEELDKFKKENATLARQLDEARSAASRVAGALGGLPSLGSTANINNNNGADEGSGRGQSVITDLESKLAMIEKEKIEREKKEKKKLKKLLTERDEALAKLNDIQKLYTSAAIQLRTMVESKILTIGRLTSFNKKQSPTPSATTADSNKYKAPELVDAATISMNDQTFTVDIAFVADAAPDVVTSTSGLRPLCQQVAQGFNCSVITYGAMRSGKTTSIQSLLPLLLRDVLEPCNAKSSTHEISVETQCIEISVDGLSDLFSPATPSSQIEIRKDSYNNVIFQGCSSQQCPNILAFRDIASALMTTSARNRKRPRSHILYIVNCAFKHRVTSVATFGKFVVADLAGMGSLGNQDDVDSAAYVNSSIIKLQQVVDALTTEGQTAVPYKADLLTMALSDCLGGNSRTALLVHVPVSAIDDEDDGGAESTQQSLTLCSRAREIKNALIRRSETNETLVLRRTLMQIDAAALPNLNSEIGTIREV